MIYDCFPFFNELELLEIRLHELGDTVDRFVLVEATRTHSGLPKPLHYHQHRRRFSAWQSRIIHVVLDDLPVGADPWVLENRQRDGISRGLTNARDDDVILVSDVDEIPRASKVTEYQDTPEIKLFQQRLCYYFLNYVTDEPWPGTRMLSYHDFRRLGGAQAVRNAPGAPVADGGWHFSYMGGVCRIQEKLRAYAHQEYNTAHHTNPLSLARALETGRDLFGREIRWRLGDDDGLPAHVQGHRARFRDWIYEGSPAGKRPDDGQYSRLLDLCRRIQRLPGDVVTLGCSDIAATIDLANACHPETLWAVDEWPEGPRRPSPAGCVFEGGELDPYPGFLRAVRTLTLGNVRPVVMAADRFLEGRAVETKLCYFDGFAGRRIPESAVRAARSHLVPGGILCGTAADAQSSRESSMTDDLLPGHERTGDFWWWEKPAQG